MTELFDLKDLRRPLTFAQRQSQLQAIVRSAKLGRQFFYSMKQVAGILHWSYDQIFDAVHLFKIDSVGFLNLIRIPWWSLAEYLIDPAEDVDKAASDWIQSIPLRKEAPCDG